MNKNARTKVSAIVLVMAAGLLGGCAQSNTTTITTTQPPIVPTTTSTTPTPTPIPNVGVGVTVNGEPDGRIFWTVKDPEGGVAEGHIKITVGNWVHETDRMTGYVTPLVNPGNYSVTAVYTDPNGNTLTDTRHYTLQNTTSIKMIPKQVIGPLHKEWEAVIQLIGNPIITGTITIYDHDGNKIAQGPIGKDNTARIKMPVRDEPFSEDLVIKYSGDTYTPATQGHSSFQYLEGY